MDVIGAGLGRTGTLSLKAALEQLGCGPCLHMLDVIGNPGQIAAWPEAIMTVTGPDLIALHCRGLWLVSQAADQVSASTAPAGTRPGLATHPLGGSSPASSA